MLVVWDPKTFEELRRISHGEWVNCLAASNISSLVATGGYHSTRVWNSKTGEELLHLPRAAYAKTLALAFGANDTELFIASDDCSIVCINVTTAKVERTFIAREPGSDDYNCPRFISLSPDLTRAAFDFPWQTGPCVEYADHTTTKTLRLRRRQIRYQGRRLERA